MNLLPLKTLYDRTPMVVLLLILMALLGYAYAADQIASTKYRCDALRTLEPPTVCSETIWSRFQ